MEAAPLNYFWRYAIDVCLVFIYMFLLITSNKPGFFLPILAIIFSLYFIRDLLVVRQHIGEYKTDLSTLQRDGSSAAKLGKVRKVVYGEAIALDEFNSSVITTVSWALYFAVLTFLYRITNSRYAPIIVTFAIAGLVLYRLDKSHRPAGETAHGFRFGARISIIAALVIAFLSSSTHPWANRPIWTFSRFKSGSCRTFLHIEYSRPAQAIFTYSKSPGWLLTPMRGGPIQLAYLPGS